MGQGTTTGNVISHLILLLLLGNGESGLMEEGAMISGRHSQLNVDDDVVLNNSGSDWEKAQKARNDRHKRQVYKPAVLWKDNTIFYDFEDDIGNIFFSFTEDEYTRKIFKKAVDHISSRTCIDFQEDPTAGNRIHIKYDYKRNGCWSDMGVQGGVQNMWLGKGCLHVGPIIHEMVHTLGVGHMHNRDDRDDYIQVDFSSMKENTTSQFKRMIADEVINYTPYEYGSIMHYGADAFTRNGNITIAPLDQTYLWTIGSPIPSFYDISTLNKLYNCTGIVIFGQDCCRCGADLNRTTCSNGGVPNPRQCDVCLCPYGYGGRYCDERAPLGKWIEVRVIGVPSNLCYYGCCYGAIEPKVLMDKMVTNPEILLRGAAQQNSHKQAQSDTNLFIQRFSQISIHIPVQI
ncbi:astacin [Cooperia oncophora]